MKGRLPVGYVVRVDGGEVVLNLLDMHRGQLASHAQGVSTVTEVGSLLLLNAGSRALVMKVVSLSFDEPKEAHRLGVGSSTHQSEPLRNVSGLVVGILRRSQEGVSFQSDSLATPPLGAEAYPLNTAELGAILGGNCAEEIPITLGEDLRGGGTLRVGLDSLVSRHVAVLGGSGQGKSCFTAAVLQQLVKLEGARIVVFDINGEYAEAFPGLPPGAVKLSTLGGQGNDTFKIPYYALGRFGLHRLLIPSERTQRPALSFALEHLHQVRWFSDTQGVGLRSDSEAYLFDDCRQQGALEADHRLRQLRSGNAAHVDEWPHMASLAALVAESHSLQPIARPPGVERNAFSYSNISPLVTRIRRLVEDPMFQSVVDVEGGAGVNGTLSWEAESAQLVEEVFGGENQEPWRVHVVNLRHLAHDLAPFLLGALLELYAFELFRRGQTRKVPTLLVLEEAHHYLRPAGSGEESGSSLAYERLAKEGRKFGLALWLSTQRPSEISPTVLSQCNNWVTFRLTSEKDLAAVQSASEWADRREVRRIAGLPRQTAILFGGSIPMPTVVRAPTANPRPLSDDAEFGSWVAMRPAREQVTPLRVEVDESTMSAMQWGPDDYDEDIPF